MTLAPSNPNIIYVGTGVNTIFTDSSYGDGVYKSVDAGETWHHMGLEDTRHLSRRWSARSSRMRPLTSGGVTW